METFEFKPVAYIHNDLPTKFGVPRQSNVAPSLISTIEFTKEFSDEACVRGLEGFDWIWLIWIFSEFYQKEWTPTVRPPWTGGNTRFGVFATRSPHRPNPIGISCVRLVEIRKEKGKLLLTVQGADMMDGTPILDIKPYIKYAESHPDAMSGFIDEHHFTGLTVDEDDPAFRVFDRSQKDALIEILKSDPRPQYQDDPDRIYGFFYAGRDVRFKVQNEHILIVDINKST
ncbi:MAG: tRNA (N6-threonylcarbamoyladenosine(37)-N6)-methyltransferase TrmO [Dehalococcoidales bacterium]|nr:tRNA (N6-threonylcarbamoyladenosine(37)-N6)-methyltransferase TrmO [Dehalococcoidales bacterium]